MADNSEVHQPLTPQNAIPPVLLTFLSFRTMVGLGSLFILLAAGAFVWRNSIGERPKFARILAYTIPLPYIAIMAGWTLAEVGRQPWLVYKLMTTSQGVSPVASSSIMTSLIAFICVYGVLGILDIYLLRKYARRGPEA